ncbi:MAG: pyruvate kinase [Candidatus Competibacteraceae bacterium]|nr:MAG: pyruvate kinase [Candidatus Competibacteraceae bacterium]
MVLPSHRTKMVCTIGPASAQPEVLTAMMQAGMNVCRLNFAHGQFDGHAATIRLIRDTAAAIGHRISIYADLPGPKIRLGNLVGGQCTLERGAPVTLTTQNIEGTADRLPVRFPELAQSVGPGDRIFLNDGFLQLTVNAVSGTEVACRIDVGGLLLSHKGVNIPGKELPIKAFTPRDHECLDFAVRHGADVISQSFVQKADDLHEVREAARAAGGNPLIFGKIERAVALQNIDTIVQAADGIMVARGDLGVETPIEGIAIAQKRLIQHARRAGKLVITATQMLESMVGNPRPTRAEVTDVANAILDGTDCVMLSEESAMGQYPVDAVQMLARIAAATEAGWRDPEMREVLPHLETLLSGRPVADDPQIEEVIAADVVTAAIRLGARMVITPTTCGQQPRRVAAHRLPCWVVAFTPNPEIGQQLNLCSGVHTVDVPAKGTDWKSVAGLWCKDNGFTDGLAVVTHHGAQGQAEATYCLEIIDLATYFT